jgi:hypothetical protein
MYQLESAPSSLKVTKNENHIKFTFEWKMVQNSCSGLRSRFTCSKKEGYGVGEALAITPG